MISSINVNIPPKPARSYPIVIASGLLKNAQEWIAEYCHSGKVVIISDDTVAKMYGELLCDNLQASGYQVELIIFPSGENSKNIATKTAIEEEMFAFGCDRHTLCVALGGGVVGDMAGFIAATYMRGMDFIQVPTSMLAMIDSSVGGKVAVNSSYGKNNIGAFWQPKAVIMDIDLLKSLPKDQIINGFFEAVKIFLTCDGEHFEFCESHLDLILALEEKSLIKVLQKAVALKAMVVEIDEEERNLRMILNYGHTIAHALEKLSKYVIMHGFAVGLGMLIEAKVANLLGLLADTDFIRVSKFLSRLDINTSILKSYDNQSIIAAMRGDKKNLNQETVLVLLTGIGSVKNIDNKVAFPVAESVIAEALDYVRTSSLG
ncbi:3-dehydroquinate synthase [Aquella oligotrophica]|uniref:3-dehydroquinate synthase n=1 Tax=Aquella oligotrophica TaxID=2067065 RepID=A0A2I7N6P3_9NEIS|nr:3-dehydroquinate synthase [Aquella oligotrophica]AUR52118.1 3-dehydroquinate synthase [Aquella oligotrophica]